MTEKYPFIPEHLEKALEDTSIPLIDILHGHLKVEMLDLEQLLDGDNDDRFLQGYMQALTNIYALTYNLSIDRALIEKDQNDTTTNA
jgi:hypothetical protein